MNVTFKEFLARLMEDREMRPADLARAAGISHVAVANYLGGRIPDQVQAKKMADVFGLTVDALLYPSDATSAKLREEPTEYVTVDWRTRALTAEGELHSLKKALLTLAEKELNQGKKGKPK